MSNSKQVQLRGGTSQEHENFIGAPREITVDTTKNTIRVHDGSTVGGHSLAKSEELENEINRIEEQLADFENNISKSHNHDGSYSKLNHNHDDWYERKVSGLPTAKFKALHGYYGISDPEGYDDVWVRTTRNGLIPYQSGGYSSIGTSSWRFATGWFNWINTKHLIVDKSNNESIIEFPATVNDPGYIKHVEHDNTAGMYFSVSDDEHVSNDQFYFGSTSNGHFTPCATLKTNGDLWIKGWLMTEYPHMVIGGRRIYFDGERPWDAPEGSISFG